VENDVPTINELWPLEEWLIVEVEGTSWKIPADRREDWNEFLATAVIGDRVPEYATYCPLPLAPDAIELDDDAKDRQSRIDALREVADWLERNPEVKLPHVIEGGSISIYAVGREGMAQVARAMGNCEKVITDTFLYLTRKFGPVTVEALEYREKVCERKVIGRHTETKKVATEFKEVEVEVEDVEWDCKSLFKGDEQGEQGGDIGELDREQSGGGPGL